MEATQQIHHVRLDLIRRSTAHHVVRPGPDNDHLSVAVGHHIDRSCCLADHLAGLPPDSNRPVEELGPWPALDVGVTDEDHTLPRKALETFARVEVERRPPSLHESGRLQGAAGTLLADKEPRPGEHEHFTSPLWKQGVGSTIHCVAGDATGIILAATVTALLGLPMWIDLIVEYIAGFSFGLFIFQSLFMKKMMGGTYWENVRKSFMPEFISMNAMMAGMAPTMSLLMMGRDMRAMDPLEFVFWGVMSLGVMVGFTTAYPFNVWMVKKKVKHGLMTERPEAAGQQRDMSGMKDRKSVV